MSAAANLAQRLAVTIGEAWLHVSGDRRPYAQASEAERRTFADMAAAVIAGGAQTRQLEAQARRQAIARALNSGFLAGASGEVRGRYGWPAIDDAKRAVFLQLADAVIAAASPADPVLA